MLLALAGLILFPALVLLARLWAVEQRLIDPLPAEMLALAAQTAGILAILLRMRPAIRCKSDHDAHMAELYEELVHVSRLSAMGEMAAGLAHELNQPLAAATNFLGAADLALAAGDSGRARDLVQLASRQALRAGDIIKRVYRFVSRGKADVREEPLGQLLVEAIDLILVRNGRPRASVRFLLDAGRPRIMADRVQIQQVIVNLVRNAMQAAGEEPDRRPEILIRSRPAPGGMVEISVEDNGPGIAPEILVRWPEPFLSGKEDGMGIGLSICRRIIEAHGGILHVSNKAEGGALVRFTVPAATGEAEAAA